MNFNSLKAICMLIFSLSIVPCLSAQQSSTSQYQLATHVIFSYSNGAKLEARVEKFDTTQHDIVFVDLVLRMIDGSPYFGTDGMLPHTQFQSLVFYFDDTSVQLETSGLFDP